MASVPNVTPTSLGLHEHRCIKCGKPRPCYSIKCRAQDGADPPWTCSACLAEHGIDVELPSSLLVKLEDMAAADNRRPEDLLLALIESEWHRRHDEEGVR